MNKTIIKEKTMRSILKIVILPALFILAGCEAPLAPNQAGVGAPGQVLIRIGDGADTGSADGPARSLVPTTAPVFAMYKLVFTAEGREMVYRELETTREKNAINGDGYAVNLEEGEWTLDVRAYVLGTNTTFLEAARGSNSFTVSSLDRNPDVYVYLTPIPVDGETRGTFTWNLDVSAVTGSVFVEGKIAAVVNGEVESWSSLPSGVSGSMAIISGYYVVKFTLEKGGKSAGVYQAVHIYPGLTTKAEGADFTFTNDDFKSEKFLAGTVTINNIPGSRTTAWKKVRPYQDSSYVYPLADEVDVGADSKWALAVPGNADEVYFRVRMKMTDSDEVWILTGKPAEDITSIPDTGIQGIALSSVWSETKYTVTFALGGGTGNPPPARTDCCLFDTIFLPLQEGMTAPAGRNFIGWRIEETNYSPRDSYVVTGNVTLTARWGTSGPKQPSLINRPSIPEVILSSIDRDDDDNFIYSYVVYAGRLKDVYLGTLFSYQYEGIPGTYTFAKNTTATTAESISSSISETVSNSITSEISFSVKGKWPVVEIEEKVSVSGSRATQKGYSTTNTTSTTSSWGVTETHSFNFNDSYPIGYYRLAQYAQATDVYFYFQTDADMNLVENSFESIVCARTNDGFVSVMEYSADGNFVYTPVKLGYTYNTTSEEYEIDEFWKESDFEKPKGLTDIETEWKRVRLFDYGQEYNINNPDRFSNPYDVIEFHEFMYRPSEDEDLRSVAIEAISRLYESVVVKISMRQKNHSQNTYKDRYVILYPSAHSMEINNANAHYLWVNANRDTNYESANNPFTWECEAPISYFMDAGRAEDETTPRIIIRYGTASRDGSNNGKHEWFNLDVKVQLVFKPKL